MQYSQLALFVLATCLLCHVPIATARPGAYIDYDPTADRLIIKRADSADPSLVMARLRELIGAEQLFSENDSHGRLSNLQRLG